MTAQSTTNLQDENIADEARKLHEAGQYREAAHLYEDLLTRYTDNAQLHALLGASLVSIGYYDQARDALEASVKLDPDDTITIVQLARAVYLSGDLAQGKKLLDSALAADPGSTTALLCQAEFALFEKNHDEACLLLEDHATHDNADIAIVMTYARAVTRTQGPEASIDILTKHADRQDLNKKNQRQLASRLANVLDKAQRYDEAFEWIKKANTTPRHSQQLQMLQKFMDDVTASATPARCADLPHSNVTDESPVFVVGMPRAGTTLLEQTIAAHPQGFGMGELMSIGAIAERLYGWNSPGLPRIERMRMVNIESLEREASDHLKFLHESAGQAIRIVDKMPNNFFLLPVIKQLYPNARILHARRSPRDTCLSCLFNLNPHDHWYTSHLDELAVFYNQYDRLMSHWKRALEIPVLDVSYERMVLDRRDMIAEILEFLGLPWDESCIAQEKEKRAVFTGSFEQAQQAIYTTSLQRWKHYESHLGPLLDHLQVPEPRFESA
jgi:tetratricopeptide (TPR) repeat protein